MTKNKTTKKQKQRNNNNKHKQIAIKKLKPPQLNAMCLNTMLINNQVGKRNICQGLLYKFKCGGYVADTYPETKAHAYGNFHQSV